MNIKALVGAAALSALVMSGAAVAYAQDAGQAPGTMAPIPNPPEKPKASHHHAGKHHKASKHHKAAKHHKGKGSKAKAKKAEAAPAAAPAQ